MVEDNFPKDPNAVLDYAFDWSDWLAESETISSYIITVDSGLTKDSDSESSGIITVWLSGGTHGTDYIVACEITTSTSPSRTEERSINIRCRER